MKSRFRIRWIDLMVVAAIVGYAGWKSSHRYPAPRELSAFVRNVDLSPLHRVAVQADGRLRSFESHARTYMGYVTGPRKIDGQSDGFTYLDMLIRPDRYVERLAIYVKNKQVREQIVTTLEAAGRIDASVATQIRRSGMISRFFLSDPEVVALLRRLGEDLIRTAKPVDAIQSALHVLNPQFLMNSLRVVGPPDGSTSKPWISLSELTGAGGAPFDEVHAGVRAAVSIPGLPEGFQDRVREIWAAMITAWRAEDAAAVNAQVAALGSLLPTATPLLYPSTGRLAMESWYFRNKSMTWVWWFYALALVPLLISVIYGWAGARKLGMAMFVFAFLGHTASLGIRWYISGRWPNSNMFEAVHTSAWFGGAAALVIEWMTRRTPLKNLFALGSAAVSMAALMAAYFLPAQLDSSISNKMAALNDVWLYIHTNMIILSYALIGVACVTALLFLRHRWCLAWDHATVPKLRLLLIPVAMGFFNYTAYLLLMHAIDPENRGLTGLRLPATAAVCAASLALLVMELMEARARAGGNSAIERAAAGGASALILASTPRNRFLTEDRPAAGQVLDAATMVILELSFITLWAGIVMGAIWADHSWGRPWGWDPKEVFALNTFFIFLILIHVRLKVRDKGFWTAVLAVIGFEVMMFNWIVVNFIISGLHSYA